MRKITLVLIFFCIAGPVLAMDEMTVYDLLGPDSHQFAIRYDVSATDAGTSTYFNIVRPGSEASNENVFDRATGKEMTFVMTNGKEAKASGQAEADTKDETGFIKITLPHPVPQDGEFRLR